MLLLHDLVEPTDVICVFITYLKEDFSEPVVRLQTASVKFLLCPNLMWGTGSSALFINHTTMHERQYTFTSHLHFNILEFYQQEKVKKTAAHILDSICLSFIFQNDHKIQL